MSEEAVVEVKEEVKVEEAQAAPEVDVKTEDAPPPEEATAAADDAGEGEQEEGADEGEGEDEAGEDEEMEAGGDAVPDAAADGTASDPMKKRAREGPIKLGFKTFNNSKECAEYFKHLLSTAPMDTDMNEYEYRALLDLIQQGHPSAATKIGGGVRAFQVRHFRADFESRAFFAVRKDGTLEDFSYIKCLGELFPGEITFHNNKRQKSQHGGGREGGRGGGRGGGFRGGRGRGFRGRGGRGRGRFGGRGGGGGRH